MAWTPLAHSNSEYMDLSLDRDRGLARMRRSDRSITLGTAPQVIQRFMQDLERLIPPTTRRSFRLLVDSREAPRADPELEATLSGQMNPIMMKFACVAILIKTPIGILQMRRLLRGWNTPADVFSDEAEAIIWLLRHPIAAL
ncbi:MAG TPA: hypothetical protein PKI03_08035 [Pseudomonadota bacterium]|nr:hypothetical protein [Pseudomonadota bacterium]